MAEWLWLNQPVLTDETVPFIHTKCGIFILDSQLGDS